MLSLPHASHVILIVFALQGLESCPNIEELSLVGNCISKLEGTCLVSGLFLLRPRSARLNICLFVTTTSERLLVCNETPFENILRLLQRQIYAFNKTVTATKFPLPCTVLCLKLIGLSNNLSFLQLLFRLPLRLFYLADKIDENLKGFPRALTIILL